MKKKEEITDVGIIVGRFQVAELHEGHIELIQGVMDTHDRVILFLGLSAARVTRNNPMDFEARKAMINHQFPDVEVHYIKDCPGDEKWSCILDSMIHDHIGPGQTVTLYGGRDAFVAGYNGIFPTQEIEPHSYMSGTLARKKISRKTKASPDFRAGVIWAAYNQYPHCFPTVDVAVIDRNKNRLLLARKAQEDKFRFIGGFVEGKETFEYACVREVMEESHVEIGNLQYITSCPIDDWRYRGELDGIVTSFYVADYTFGPPVADDDIEELKWFDIAKVRLTDLVDNHQILLSALLAHERK